MRGAISTIALIVSIAGLLLVIAYGASDAFLTFQSDEADLDRELLLTSLAPNGWETAPLGDARFSEEFIAPCLQTPLLAGVGIDGRGATGYVPPTGAAPGARMLVIQTSAGNARAIMDDVARDTENGCQRGITVGTVDSATVEAGVVDGAERSALVSYSQVVGDTERTYQVLMFQQGNFVAHASYETTDDPGFASSDLTALGGLLAAQMVDPPTPTELEAAGATYVPTTAERWATRINTESESILTARGRYPLVASMAALGGLICLLFLIGARMSRAPEPLPATGADDLVLGLPQSFPTVDDYGAPQRRWIRNAPATSTPPPADVGFDLEPAGFVDEPDLIPDALEPEPEPEPAGPPPVIEFPQQPIEEKLKILKDARLKEPKREHRAMREVRPDFEWTDEISKPEPPSDTQPAQEQAQPASRKAVMRKLRAQSDSS